MVKSVLSVSHQGLRDWVIQRISAIYMAIFSISLIGYLVYSAPLTFQQWQGFVGHTGVKVAIILMLFALVWHAWIGIWTIFTDYVKPFVVRLILNCFVLLMLIACLIWGILILWSV